MRPWTKRIYKAWYDARLWLGLEAWYHTPDLCRRHLIPRTHRVDFTYIDYPRGVMLCGKGERNYWTGELIEP